MELKFKHVCWNSALCTNGLEINSIFEKFCLLRFCQYFHKRWPIRMLTCIQKKIDAMGTSRGWIKNVRHYPFGKRLYKVRNWSNKIISLNVIEFKFKHFGWNWHFDLMIMEKIEILNILPAVILPNCSQKFAHFIVSMHAKICV